MTDSLASWSRRHWPSLLLGLLLVLAGLLLRRPLLHWFTGDGPEPLAAGDSRSQQDPDIHHYTCSMHPSVEQRGPGKCPICSMDLTPVTQAQYAQGVVFIDDARRQSIGVRTGAVIEAPLQSELRAVGRVSYDESRLTDVSVRVHGWIKRLFVSQTGQQVRAGEPLFSLYSPELYNAEQDFLLALGAPSANPAQGLAGAARRRLELLGSSTAQIEQLQKAGKASEAIEILAPSSGFVIEKSVVEGASVEAGMRLYRIAALDRVWVEAEVYEADLPRVRVGQTARVTLDYLPGRVYEAKLTYIYPYLDSQARVGRVRVELDNRELQLRPGMYASVSLLSDATLRLQVPVSAVVYTGPRRLVFIDQGEGRFVPREVHIGAQANGNYEVLDGLTAGERVATSGVFLIAAEARISSAAKYWESAPETGGASGATPGAGGVPGALPAALEPAPRPPPAAPAPAKSRASAAPERVSYSCPMHPEVQSTAPGACPKCGMPLQPKPRGPAR
jgi:membrane fusion protein, copper/silver efflux system